MYKNFESKSSIDEKKKNKTERLKEKLKLVREDYESVKRIKDLEEERGDSSWILPSLEKRIESDDRKEKKKKKKDKKKKHKKKSKKHKKSSHSDVSSDENEDSDDGWEESGTTVERETSQKHMELQEEEKTIAPPVTNVEREDWMLSTSLLDVASKATYSREHGKTKQRKTEERRREVENRKVIQESRELNPYWKKGGTGLPTENDEIIKTQGEATKNYKAGDGGKSWLQKSYDRAVKQAEEQGVSVEEIISKRYGSMEKFNAMLKAADRTSSRAPASSRDSRGGWKKNKPEDEEDPPKRSSFDKSRHREQEHVKKNSPIKEKQSSSSSNEDEDDDEVREEAEEERFEKVPLSEKQKNEISAKILRAELMGDDELAEKLKEELESGYRKVTISKDEENETHNVESGEREVILTRTDKHGNLYPVQLQTDSDELARKRKRQKKKIMSTHDADGKRVKYFEDDDNMDLKTMVQQEHLTSASDQSAQMARLASKHLGKAQGDDYTLDDMFVTASATKGAVRSEDKRTKEKAMKEHKQRELQLASCRFCFENSNIAKHLIIAIGKKTYLALPIHKSFTEGHCLILPLNHVIGQTYMDEDVLQEVKLFKDTLCKVFSTRNEDVIFLETCKNLRHQNHCVIECIPVDKEIGDMASIYFKKALMEVGSEWSQNKKVVNINNKNGVSKAIPKGLPYFAVEFGLDGGFAHVIEDEETFPHYFGKEILGGMMDAEPIMWRKPPKQSFDHHKRKVLKFSDMWKEYDWTRQLKN